VERPRLIERLRGALNCTLILVSAPAGSGKTTLVSDWVRQVQEQTPTSWLSLDAGDNDPVRFWDYFIGALRTRQPAVGETALSLLHAQQPCSTEAVLTALINDLSTPSEDFAIVLDDYHLVTA
jgi:LuxR family maltose regulon positive regulatory protein